MNAYKTRWLAANQFHPRTAVIVTSVDGAVFLLRACRTLYGNSVVGVDVFVSFAAKGARRVQIQRNDADDAITLAVQLWQDAT